MSIVIDKGLYTSVRIKVNEVYDEAYDLIPCKYNYEETDEKK